MNDALLMILIVLMSLTLLVLAWVVIGLLLVARCELPKLQRQMSEMNGRVAQLLDELVPTVQHTTLALKEAERALHEAAETIENLHIVSDNIRHKLEVADAVGAKVRRLPEKTARFLGRVMHQGFKLGGQLISSQLEKRLQPKRATVYDGARGLDTPVQASPPSGLNSPVQAGSQESLSASQRQDAAVLRGSTGGDACATSENSAPFEAESVPTGEVTTAPHATQPASHTTHKEG